MGFIGLVLLLFSCGVAQKKKKYVNKTYSEIKKSFPEAQVEMIKDSIKVIFPNNLVFDVSSSKLKSGFETKLNRFGEILDKFTATNLLIAGHTDASGNENTNLSLSLARASSVKEYLAARKIDTSRLFTWGLGEKKPIASNETAEGRMKNRRVEFVVLYKPTN